MRVLIVDDAPPRRHLLTLILRSAGHEILTASNGTVALDMLETEVVDAIVSDVKMPRMDGFELCRAIRRDTRLRSIPFVFYSSVFTGGAAHEFGRDLGATAYIDAKRVLPEKVAKEIEQVVSRLVKDEYHEALVRLQDDLEFARRYHAVVSLTSAAIVERGIDELDHLLSRLDTERVNLARQQDVVVPIAEINRLRDLSDHLREAINRPLATVRDGGNGAGHGPQALSDDVAASVRLTVRRINHLVRKLSTDPYVTSRDPGRELDSARRP